MIEHIEKKIVPDYLEETLLDNYRDYEKICVKGSHEEKVWFYYVDVFLSSINAKVTMYRGKKRKINFISDVFSVSDEACAILMLINYFDRWKMMAAEPDKRKHKRKEFDAKFTSSRKGSRTKSWSDEGRKTFNEWCFKIQELRKEESSGRMIEELTKNHFRGNWTERQEPIQSEEISFDVFEEDSWTEGVNTLPV